MATSAVIRSTGFDATSTAIQSKVWTSSDALKKAGLALVACWLMAGLTVFIPIVHFVSVPGFIAMGPILGFLLYRAYDGKTELRAVEATCPKCKGALELSGPTSSWPQSGRCEACGTVFNAEIVES